MSKEVINEIDDNIEDNDNESDSGGIPKYVYLSVILLFKIFAFTHHINQNNPSDNKSSVSETADTSFLESVHACFYSHTGVWHIIFDVVIYWVFVTLFGIVSYKLIRSLLLIRDAKKK